MVNDWSGRRLDIAESAQTFGYPKVPGDLESNEIQDLKRSRIWNDDVLDAKLDKC